MNPEDKNTDIETLKSKADPAWLWDFERGRIVWANRAGIVFWGEDTLFDLLDYRFDSAGATVKKIREIAEKLEKNEGGEDEVIFFPEAGQLVKCICRIAPLEGGRNGLLLAAKRTRGKGQEAGGELFAAIANNSPFALGVFDRAGRLIYANRALQDIFGAAEPETGEGHNGQKGGFKLGEWLGDEDDAYALVSRILLVGSHSEARMMHTRFGPRTQRITARRLALEEGETALLIYFHDIEDRRRYEMELETRLNDMKSAQDAPLREEAGKDSNIADEDTKIQITTGSQGRAPQPEDETVPLATAAIAAVPETSPEAAETVPKPDPADTPLTDLLEKPEEAADTAKDKNLLEGKDKTAFSAIAQALRTNNPVVLEELDLTSKSKEIMLVDAPEQKDERPKPVLVEEPQARAPSAELARSRAQVSELQAILDSASDGIITLDKKGRICNLNTAAETMLSVSADDVRGRKFTSLLSEASASDVQNYLEAVSEQGIAGIFRDGCEIEALRGGKETVPLFLTIGPVKSDDILQYCAVIRDVSQWKQAEEDLRKAKEQAEENSEKKSDFLARISHELRTPLNAIIGFSEVMSEEKFGPIANDRYKGYVSDIRTSSEHLLSLINDLLDITKIESGKLDLDFTSVELDEIVNKSVSLMQPQATRERIIIRSSLPDNLPPIVADYRSMRQITLNLLSNAIKFTRSGGQVIVTILHNETGEVVLRVRDTGIGMSEDELKKAMEPYRQIRSVHETNQPGTGLGLPLTRALAEANRAEFKIESAKGKGTLVQITFPTTRVLAE